MVLVCSLLGSLRQLRGTVILYTGRGVALGDEFRAKGSHVFLGPSTGPLGRSAFGGRAWEGFGPGPYLAGVFMNASVVGVQSTGVQACSKHMIGNEQETHRTSTTLENGTVIDAISSDIDDRTLHELYLWPFADAIKAGTSTVMCSYNQVNGTCSCANSGLLQRILKTELAFPGYVTSQWYATHRTESFANGGLDLEKPGSVSAFFGPSYFRDALLNATLYGVVTEDHINDMAKRVMTPYFRLGQDQTFPTVDRSNGPAIIGYQYGFNSPLLKDYPAVEARDVRWNHAELTRKIGAAGTVLVKNVNGALPLTHEIDIGVFGNDAVYPSAGAVYFSPEGDSDGFEWGTLDVGGGSGTVRHTNFGTSLEALQKHVRDMGGRLQIIPDNNELAEGVFKTIYPVPEPCIVFLKAYATEDTDRKTFDLQWNATKVVESTAAMCPNTIVVTHGPDQTGNCIVDVLWGVVEPSERLPYSIPKRTSDYGPDIVRLSDNALSSDGLYSELTESQMIDYRHFDVEAIDPLYEFGFGLSYSTFHMAGGLNVDITANLSSQPVESKGMAPGGLLDLWTAVAKATLSITNVGNRTGSAVPQLYLSFPLDTTPSVTPLKILRGFQKVLFDVGHVSTVQFKLKRRDLS
ncbi:hypothetical protein TruAng_002899 [Truncatella angustata]|nr:hypothetical protein TruAng_002899 [Truncatella angustata]